VGKRVSDVEANISVVTLQARILFCHNLFRSLINKSSGLN